MLQLWEPRLDSASVPTKGRLTLTSFSGRLCFRQRGSVRRCARVEDSNSNFAKERFREFDCTEESGRGQPHSKTLARNRTLFSKCREIYGPRKPRASVLECGCPLPLSPATVSQFLAPHPATVFSRCFDSPHVSPV